MGLDLSRFSHILQCYRISQGRPRTSMAFAYLFFKCKIVTMGKLSNYMKMNLRSISFFPTGTRKEWKKQMNVSYLSDKVPCTNKKSTYQAKILNYPHDLINSKSPKSNFIKQISFIHRKIIFLTECSSYFVLRLKLSKDIGNKIRNKKIRKGFWNLEKSASKKSCFYNSSKNVLEIKQFVTHPQNSVRS